MVSLTELADADRIRRLIQAVWGEQLPPPELIRAMQHAGSVLYGAEHDGDLVGFVWGFAGLAGGLHLHSHMLGVIRDWQGGGVGYALKLAQRAAALDHRIDEVRWTFDPLLARNGRFNLVKLGAEATRFLPGFYGEMTDLLNREDRSDRFDVRWRLRSPRVAAALAGEPVEPEIGPALLVADGSSGALEPRPVEVPPEPGCTVAIPPDHHELKADAPDLAARWRSVTGDRFKRCFDRGLVAVWVTQEPAYVFQPREP